MKQTNEANQAEGSGCPFPHEAAADAGCPVGGDARAAHLHAALTAHRGAGHLTQGDAAPLSAPGDGWSAEAEAVIRERSAAWSHGDAAHAEAMMRRAAESRAAARREEITALFLRSLGKKLGYGHPLSERGEELRFTWTPEAEARLAEVPEFCRELTRWRVEWTAHKLGLGTTITPHEMDVKYETWGRVSHAIEARARDSLPWTESARARFERVPDFVRGQVLEAIEGNARRIGAVRVDDRVVDTVIERWSSTGDFHEGLYGFK
jgi:hypothetical protein